MKSAVIVLGAAALALTACTSTRQGAGFSGIGSENSVTSTAQGPWQSGYTYKPSPSETVTVRKTADGRTVKNYTYGSPPPVVQTSAGSASVPRNDVPVFYSSATVKKSGYRSVSVLGAGRSAAGYGSSRWGPKYTVPLSFSDAEARLKVVVVEDMTFGVVGKMKRPFVGPRVAKEPFSKAAISAVTQRTGCTYGGSTVTQTDQYATIYRLAILLSC
jgi:hypothetical protein